MLRTSVEIVSAAWSPACYIGKAEDYVSHNSAW
jgi:hypothetical protein